MSAVDRLLCVEQIKRVKAMYFRALDAEDWSTLEDVFTIDAVVELPGTAPFASRTDFLEGLKWHHEAAQVVTVHLGYMAEIDVLDEGHARGVWAMSDLVDRIWLDDGARECFRGFGHYHEHYVRVGDRWQISDMRLTRIRVDWLEPGENQFPHRGDAPLNVHQRRRH